MRALPRAAVQVAASTVVGEQCVFGCVKESRLAGSEVAFDLVARQAAPMVIGERCLIFNQVVIYEGSRLGDG